MLPWKAWGIALAVNTADKAVAASSKRAVSLMFVGRNSRYEGYRREAIHRQMSFVLVFLRRFYTRRRIPQILI